MTEILLLTTILAPIVTALVQMMKTAINLNDRFIPLLAAVVGLGVGIAAFPISDVDLAMRIWAGVLAGLTGVGLYEVVTQQLDKK